MKFTKLDILFSEFIRRRAIQRTGGCERCLTPKHDIVKEEGTFPAWKHLQCSHFYGRSKKVIRFDEDNAAGLCPACHMYLTSQPLIHVEWFRQYLGEERFEYLQARAYKPHKPDIELITLYLKEKIELTNAD